MASTPARRAGYRPGTVALERALSKLGLASRTEARAWILDGRVRVDGRVICDPKRAVVPERANIEIDEARAEGAAPTTVLLHKPRGVVTTRKDEKGRKTVYSCLAGLDEHVVPVGRLDFATTGLLLLTNDTRFAAWVTDPANGVPRSYVVTVRGEITPEKARLLQTQGVQDQGQWLRAESVALRKASGRESHLNVTLKEGKNREIRRLFLAIGHEVTALKRISFGALELGSLRPGEWRHVPEAELKQAFPGAPVRTTSGD